MVEPTEAEFRALLANRADGGGRDVEFSYALASSWLAMREREAKLVAWLECCVKDDVLIDPSNALDVARELGFDAALAAKETGRE